MAGKDPRQPARRAWLGHPRPKPGLQRCALTGEAGEGEGEPLVSLGPKHEHAVDKPADSVLRALCAVPFCLRQAGP